MSQGNDKVIEKNNEALSQTKQKEDKTPSESTVSETADNEKTNKQGDIVNSEHITPNVSELLQEADRLVQYTPRKLDDIKQALNLIATVDTIEPDNKSSKVIYQNILSYSLEEATKLAKQNDFEKASEWTALVEFKQPDYVLLDSTKQNIERIKADYDSKETERLAQQQQIKDLLSKAELAVKQNKLSSPAKRNAIYYYKKIIEIEPENQEAQDGINKVELSYISMIESSIRNKSYIKAKSLLTKLVGISDNDVKHNNLRQKIAQGEKQNAVELKEKRRLAAIADELKKSEIARAERLQDPLVAMQLKGSLNSALKLEKELFLVSPDNNNARDKYLAVLNIDDRNVEAIAGIKRIEQTIINQIKDAVTISNRKSALDWLEKLRVFDPHHSEILALEDTIINIKQANENVEQPDDTVDNDSGDGSLMETKTHKIENEMSEKNNKKAEGEPEPESEDGDGDG